MTVTKFQTCRITFCEKLGVGYYSSSSVGKQSQLLLLLQPTEVELDLQVGVEFDNNVQIQYACHQKALYQVLSKYPVS